ncbi:MAG: 8-amino-7-oxononanoate synthase [Myxococcales bacterium]|nr:8-amino-7-oxononanoate synthase [Myxococcales bacterium]
MSLQTLCEEALLSLEAAHLRRQPRILRGAHGPRVRLGDRDLLSLCSNDYLGLASDPRVLGAAREALDHEGLGAGASRLISGSREVHRALEAALARYVRADSALLFSSGYAANLSTLQALFGPEDLVLSDRLNHASLIDGCRLSRARIQVYEHLDVDHARRLLEAHRSSARRALLVTDALFSMDGDRAPLGALRALCERYDVALMVDEAHALGVLGPEGRGLCAEAGITPDLLVGTLGKALGSSGAFVAGPVAVIGWLENRARGHVFSTATPALLAHAALEALRIAEGAEPARAQLRRNASRLGAGLRALGYTLPDHDAPILPLHIGPAARTMRLGEALLDRGLLVQGIRPPTVPEGSSRLRITPMAIHTDTDIDAAIAAFADTARAWGWP